MLNPSAENKPHARSGERTLSRDGLVIERSVLHVPRTSRDVVLETCWAEPKVERSGYVLRLVGRGRVAN